MPLLTAVVMAVMASHAAATGAGYGDSDDYMPPVTTRSQAPDATDAPIAVTPAPAASSSGTPPSPVSSTCGGSDSFEGPDPLADWVLDVKDSGPAPPIAVFCTGDLDSAPVDYGIFDYFSGTFISSPGRTSTFTDAVDAAADGTCALRVVAGCASGTDRDFGTPTTNSASRTFTVANVGCGAGATGFTLSVAVTFDVKDQYSADYLFPNGLVPYLIDGNDRAAVTATVGRDGAEIPVATLSSGEVIRVYEGDEGVTEEFVVFTADLGDIPEGSSMDVVVSVNATNDDPCFADSRAEHSVIVVDDIRIEPRF